MAAKKSLARKKKATALAKPEGELLAQLNRQKATIKAGSQSSIKVQGREFLLNDDSLGNELYAVILENVFEHRWFSGAYDPDITAAPDCFALNVVEDEMVPHANSQDKQNDDCPTCPHNKYGSGRGGAKACQNRIRLTLLPADDANPGSIDDAETFVMYVPPTSLKSFREYASMVNNKLEVSTAMIVTKITAEPEGSYSMLEFEYDAPLKLPAAFQKQLISKISTAREQMLTPYEIVAEDGKSKKKSAPKKKRASRRKSRLS